MAKINTDTVEYITSLARIELDESKSQEYAKDLVQIVRFIEKINQLDLTNIPPSFNPHGASDVYRDDQASKFEDIQLIWKNFPRSADNLIKIPKVIE